MRVRRFGELLIKRSLLPAPVNYRSLNVRLAKGCCKTSILQFSGWKPSNFVERSLDGVGLSCRLDRQLGNAPSVPVARGSPARVDQYCSHSTHSRGPEIQCEPDRIPCF